MPIKSLGTLVTWRMSGINKLEWRESKKTQIYKGLSGIFKVPKANGSKFQSGWEIQDMKLGCREERISRASTFEFF